MPREAFPYSGVPRNCLQGRRHCYYHFKQRVFSEMYESVIYKNQLGAAMFENFINDILGQADTGRRRQRQIAFLVRWTKGKLIGICTVKMIA